LTVGCGRTVLFSVIIKTILDFQTSTASNYTLSYFYCQYGKGAQHELAPILRTLIAHLCPRGAVPSGLQKLYDRNCNKFPPGVATDEELKRTLVAILQELRPGSPPTGSSDEVQERKSFILIDALDELPLGTSRHEIIQFLDELARLHLPRLHILAISRDESDIRIGLSSWNSPHWIDKGRVLDDIRIFVSNEISKTLSYQFNPLRPRIRLKLAWWRRVTACECSFLESTCMMYSLTSIGSVGQLFN
jgi:hypothetical protein